MNWHYHIQQINVVPMNPKWVDLPGQFSNFDEAEETKVKMYNMIKLKMLRSVTGFRVIGCDCKDAGLVVSKKD